jgi:peptidoglycan/xylan/chitin deacetylase (PgdA/CDA1 family)
MGHIYHRFSWLSRPPLLVGFIIICLCLGGANAGLYGTHLPLVSAARQQPIPAEVPSEVDNLPATAAPLPAPEPEPVNCLVVACLALTFDDGPDDAKTPAILDILARNQVHATFFMVGREVPGRENLVRRVHNEGHEIGNHSWNHPNFTKLTPTAMQGQIASTQAAIAAAGIPAPTIFRPPYGAVDESVRTHVTLPIVRWNIDTEDWKTQNVAQITEHLLRDSHPGAIILMHDKYDATVQALEPAVQALKQHYQLVTVSELLQLSPGDQGQFFGL